MHSLYIPHVRISLCSSTHVQAAARSQNYLTSNSKRPNPFRSSTSTVPTFVTPIGPPLNGATVSNLLCWGGPTNPTPSAPSLDSGDWKNSWRTQWPVGRTIHCPSGSCCHSTLVTSCSGKKGLGNLKRHRHKVTDWWFWADLLKTLMTGKAKTAIAGFA